MMFHLLEAGLQPVCFLHRFTTRTKPGCDIIRHYVIKSRLGLGRLIVNFRRNDALLQRNLFGPSSCWNPTVQRIDDILPPKPSL